MAHRSLAPVEAHSESSSELSSAPEEDSPENTVSSKFARENGRKRAVDQTAIITSSKRVKREPGPIKADDESLSELSSVPDDLPDDKVRSKIAKSKAKKRKQATKVRAPVYTEESDIEKVSESVTVTPRKRGKTDGGIVKGDEEVVLEVHEEEVTITLNGSPITKNTRTVTETTVKLVEVEETTDAPKPKGKQRKRSGKKTGADKPEGEDTPPKVKKKRKTKEEKEAEAMPLAARTSGTKLLLGAHVSAAGGVHNSVTNCVHIGYVSSFVRIYPLDYGPYQVISM